MNIVNIVMIKHLLISYNRVFTNDYYYYKLFQVVY